MEGKATYRYQLQAFAAAVRDGGPVLTPPSDSLANMRVIDAVYRAESAWKGGRAEVVAVLEQATREVCSPR